MKLDFQQGSPEWHEFRRKHIGASDAPVIMGVSPWKTEYQLWQEKLGYFEQEQTFAMKRGTDMEETARQAYEDLTGIIVTPEVIVHPEKKWMSASLDGLSLARDIAVEIKCPGEKDHYLAQVGEVPEKYYPQLQHQLACLNINLLHYFSYRNGDCALVEVKRNNEYIEELYEKEESFWNKVQTFDAPPLGDRDIIEIVGPEWESAASQWKAVSEKLKDLKRLEKEARDELIKLANGRSVRGSNVKLTRIMRKGTVDYSKIPQLKDVDLEPYRKEPINMWRCTT